MLENKINPAVLFGILMLGVALFILSIGGQLWQEIYEDAGSWALNQARYESWGEFLARMFFTFFGIAMIIVVIAFLMRANWARWALIMLFIMGAFALTFFMIYLLGLDSGSGGELVLYGLAAMTYGFIIFGIFFLNNTWVLEHWKKDYVETSTQRDILDV